MGRWQWRWLSIKRARGPLKRKQLMPFESTVSILRQGSKSVVVIKTAETAEVATIEYWGSSFKNYDWNKMACERVTRRVVVEEIDGTQCNRTDHKKQDTICDWLWLQGVVKGPPIGNYSIFLHNCTIENQYTVDVVISNSHLHLRPSWSKNDSINFGKVALGTERACILKPGM